MSSSPASPVLLTPEWVTTGRVRKPVQHYGEMVDSDDIEVSEGEDEKYPLGEEADDESYGKTTGGVEWKQDHEEEEEEEDVYGSMDEDESDAEEKPRKKAKVVKDKVKGTMDGNSRTKAKSPIVKDKAQVKGSTAKSKKLANPSTPKTGKKAVLPSATSKVVKKIELKKATGKKTAKKQFPSTGCTDTIEANGSGEGEKDPEDKANGDKAKATPRPKMKPKTAPAATPKKIIHLSNSSGPTVGSVAQAGTKRKAAIVIGAARKTQAAGPSSGAGLETTSDQNTKGGDPKGEQGDEPDPDGAMKSTATLKTTDQEEEASGEWQMESPLDDLSPVSGEESGTDSQLQVTISDGEEQVKTEDPDKRAQKDELDSGPRPLSQTEVTHPTEVPNSKVTPRESKCDEVEEDLRSVPSWPSSQIPVFPLSPPSNEEATSQMPDEKYNGHDSPLTVELTPPPSPERSRSKSLNTSESPNKAIPSTDLEQASECSQPGAKKKLAPAEKITAPYRLAIMAALTDAKYLKTLDFKSISPKESAKLSRHWREVLSADLKAAFGGTGAKVARGGKSGIDPATRLQIWKHVCDGYEKADWQGALERGQMGDESGNTSLSITKLKRHFRDVMRKEGDKVIGK